MIKEIGEVSFPRRRESTSPKPLDSSLRWNDKLNATKKQSVIPSEVEESFRGQRPDERPFDYAQGDSEYFRDNGSGLLADLFKIWRLELGI